MRVICINNKPIPNSYNKFNHLLTEGKVYTVINQKISGGLNGLSALSYDLLEIKIDPPFHFSACRFIPCSDIDETELINEKELTA